MQTIIGADIFSVLVLGILIVSILNRNHTAKSSLVFAFACMACIICNVAEAVCYSFLLIDTPFPLIAYTSGLITLILFTLYCYYYIEEKIYVNKWLYFVPMIILSAMVILLIVADNTTGIVALKDGIPVISSNILNFAIMIQLLVLLYLPALALSKCKKIGFKTVLMIGFFGVLPSATSFYSILMKVPDYTCSACSLSLILVYILLENRIMMDKDIEQNKKLEQYNKIVSNVGLGLWFIICKEGTKTRLIPNDKMRELLGIEDLNLSEEENYEFWSERVDSKYTPAVKTYLKELKEQKVTEITYLWNHPKLGNIYVRCGGSGKILEDGSLFIGGYHYDVTNQVLQEKKQKEELDLALKAAEAANAAKTSFLFNMSHDIRTPMNAIIGFRDLIEKNQDDPIRRADYLKKIENASSVLLSIINNVLEMARIEKGSLTIEDNTLGVDQLIDNLYSMFYEMMRLKGIDYKTSINVTHNYIVGDIAKIREIFINILSNAYKYTESGGKVTLNIDEIPSEKEGWSLYRTTISDTGIGMSKEFIPHIFEEFSREQNVTDSKIEGTGLGMPIVKRLVELMNGTIEVKSKKGFGSTFTVTLPHKLTDNSNLVSIGGIEIDPNIFKGKRILLAEDNELNAEIATEILLDEGFLIDLAEDGEKCVKKLIASAPHYYDIILMDIQMPNKNGYEATKEIRLLSDIDKSNIPIIAMTANAFEEDKREAMKAGMNGHVSKPIDVNELMKELTRILTYDKAFSNFFRELK